MVKASNHGSARSMDSAHRAILSQKFPKFNCLCELCDCGCVMRQKHSKTCKRQPTRKQTAGGHHRGCLLTHYQQTFKAPFNIKRTLPLIPPPTPRDPNPPPMVFATTQRSEFTQHGDIKKIEPIKLTEHYERSDEPVQSITAYKEAFPGHVNFPRIVPIKGRPPQQQAQSLAPFDSRTSNKEQFKKWQSEQVVPFTELPSFAGSLLFPGKTLGELQSTSQNDFTGNTTMKREMIRRAGGNIELDGNFDHQTVHKETYTDFGPGHKASRYIPMPKMIRNERNSLETQTQHKRDFPVYRNQPERTLPADPLEPTIRLSMNSRLDFSTEQRNAFKGYDTSIHTKRDLMKQGQAEYQPPTEKFQVLTSTMADFKPMGVAKVEKVKARRPTSQTGRNPGPFDDRTTNKKFYKNWGPKPRVRYGDIQEGRIYIAPADKMEAESWNQASYKPVKFMEMTKQFKPVERPMEASGPQDFKTVHKETYLGDQPPLCKAQAYLMQQELLHHKGIRENSRRNTPNSKMEIIA